MVLGGIGCYCGITVVLLWYYCGKLKGYWGVLVVLQDTAGTGRYWVVLRILVEYGGMENF